MEARDCGVLPGSLVYFHTHSTLAEELFFYPLCVGHFFCGDGYEVNRNGYDSILVLYVEEGSGVVRQQGREVKLQAGSFALIDCYAPHFYAASCDWEIYWLHFDGVLARRYFELCTQSGGVLAPNDPRACAQRLRRIFGIFHDQGAPNEAVLSRLITDLLTELMLCEIAQGGQNTVGGMEEVLSYITKHLEQPISLDELARRAALSPFHFSRMFKRETGFSPHAYLVRSRVDRARYLLKSTNLSVKEIAFSTGFQSECGFCTTFKKWCKSTPTQYRNEMI